MTSSPYARPGSAGCSDPSRPPRLSNDPDKYIRVVKGLYQARPYCSIEKERYNIGLFKTRAQARTAILEFWKTGKGERPKFVRMIHTKAGTEFAAMFTFQIGKFPTSEAASVAVKEFVVQVFGKDAAAAMLSRAWRDGKGRASKGDAGFVKGRRARAGRGVGAAGGSEDDDGGEVGHPARSLAEVDAIDEDLEDASGAADDTDIEEPPVDGLPATRKPKSQFPFFRSWKRPPVTALSSPPIVPEGAAPCR